MFRLACEHSKNMAEKNFYSHKGFADRFHEFEKIAGPVYHGRFGENLMFDRISKKYNTTEGPENSVFGWTKSPKHRENLMGKANNISAVGVYCKWTG